MTVHCKARSCRRPGAQGPAGCPFRTGSQHAARKPRLSCLFCGRRRIPRELIVVRRVSWERRSQSAASKKSAFMDDYCSLPRRRRCDTCKQGYFIGDPLPISGRTFAEALESLPLAAPTIEVGKPMYQQFYGLRELPFELTPNPKFLFSRRSIARRSARSSTGCRPARA